MEPEDFIPISALQHYSYCPRQCALIREEQSFSEMCTRRATML